MLRLSTPVETITTLALAGHERLIGLLEQVLSLRHIGEEKALLLMGFTGNRRLVRVSRKVALDAARDHGAMHIGSTFGKQWRTSRFQTPYLRNALWDAGYAVDTLETATTWSNVEPMITAVESALRAAAAPFGERVHVFTHLSHFYPDGASIYTTYLFRLGATPEQTLARWEAMKAAASTAIVELDGTISHQHGIGVDHVPYLAAEKGALGILVLEDAMRRFDPRAIMNPGKLLAG
jgi:alkyldihydroxyacetonephosphate synthase